MTTSSKFTVFVIATCCALIGEFPVSATPTIVISDGNTTSTVSNVSGLVTFMSLPFDGAWSVVIVTGFTKPAFGTATSPALDLNIQATSTAGTGVNNLTVSFYDDGFSISNASTVAAQMAGHTVSGTGQPVTYSVFTNAGVLASCGSLTNPYNTEVRASPGALSNVTLKQVLTITSGGGATYSLDCSLITGIAPSILTDPANQIAQVGSNATFNVVAGGSGLLNYQWRFNSTPISGQTSTNLLLSNVQTTNAGNYSVVVTSSYGAITSAVAQLTVLLPRLQAKASGTNFLLMWPFAAQNLKLQTCTNLAEPNSWTLLTNPPAVVNSQNVVTDSISGSTRFYRLTQ